MTLISSNSCTTRPLILRSKQAYSLLFYLTKISITFSYSSPKQTPSSQNKHQFLMVLSSKTSSLSLNTHKLPYESLPVPIHVQLSCFILLMLGLSQNFSEQLSCRSFLNWPFSSEFLKIVSFIRVQNVTEASYLQNSFELAILRFSSSVLPVLDAIFGSCCFCFPCPDSLQMQKEGILLLQCSLIIDNKIMYLTIINLY